MPCSTSAPTCSRRAGAGLGLSYGGARIEADEIRRIFERLRLVVLPCANPDGRVYSQEVDPDWRKNRAASADGGCVGVDINRNFDVAWDFRRTFAPDSVSASDDPCHKYVYVGPAAASEPETRNIVWLLERYPGTQWFLDIHGAVPAVFHNWGLDENQSDDPGAELPQPGRSMASAGSPGTVRIASISIPRTVWSCVGCRELMAAEIHKVRERPLRRLGLLFALRNLRRERRLCL